MNAYDFDMSALQEELTRVTVDKKPGAVKKFGNFMDKLVKMPQQDGYVTLRLLPPLTGQKLPYAACRVHNMASPEERAAKKSNNLYCGRTLQNKKWVGDCFLCDYYSHLYKLADAAKLKGNIDLQEQLVAKAKSMKPLEKYYYNAMVMDSFPDTKQSIADGPLIYSCGITIHARFLEAVLGNAAMRKKSKGNIFHPINGRNFKLVKEMKPGGQYPEYGGSDWEDPSPLSEDESQIQKWLDSMNDVHALRKVLPLEEMKKAIRIFEGVEPNTKKSFDASFLSDEDGSEGAGVSVSVPAMDFTTQPVQKSVQTPAVSVPDIMEDVEEDPMVDPAFAENVRNALKNGIS